MECDHEILAFARQFKTPICFLLGISESKCRDEDVAVFIDHLIGYKKPEHTDGLGIQYLRELQAIPRQKRSSIVLDKITQYFDRSHIKLNAFSVHFDNSIPFGEHFRGGLEAWRVTQLRRDFRQLSTSVLRLSTAVESIIGLLKQEQPNLVQLGRAVKEIRYAIQSCETNLKSGIAMSVAANIHPHNVWKASNRIYLERADKMAAVFSRLDIALANRGVKSNLGGLMLKRQQRWKEGWRLVFDNYRIRKKDKGSAYEAGIGAA